MPVFATDRVRNCQILNIPAHSGPDDVRRAYLNLSKLHHPDKNNNKHESTSKFREIKGAYEWLLQNPVEPLQNSTNFESQSRGKTYWKDYRASKKERAKEPSGSGAAPPPKQESPDEGRSSWTASDESSDDEEGDESDHSDEGSWEKVQQNVKCSLEELCFGCTKRINSRVIEVQKGFKAGTKIRFSDGATFVIREKSHPIFTRVEYDLHYTAKVSLFDVLNCTTITINGMRAKHTLTLGVSCLKGGFYERIKGAGMPVRKPGPGQPLRGDIVVKFAVDYSVKPLPSNYWYNMPPCLNDLICTLEDLYHGKSKSATYSRKYTDQQQDVVSKVVTKEVQLKRGWKEGTKITYQSEGDVSYHHKIGDVVFVIREAEHERFRRVGDDLHLREDYARKLQRNNTKSIILLDGRCIVLNESKKTYPGFGMPRKTDSSKFGNLVIPDILLTSTKAKPHMAPPYHVCENCGDVGHFKKHCEAKLTGPQAQYICPRCHGHGHFFEDCTDPEVVTDSTLCHRCLERGHLTDDCSKSHKARPDYDCKFCGGKGHFPRDCSKFVPKPGHGKQCNRCLQFGHHPVDCTNPAVAGPNSKCFRCQKLGHLSKNCTNMKVATPKDQCYNCLDLGHFQRDCRNPRKASQFIECSNCGENGHYASDCGRRGHFARESTQPRFERSDHVCENCGELGHFPRHCERKKTARPDAVCNRCQGTGHFVDDCTNRQVATATTECTRCRGRGHLPDDCRKPQKAYPDYACKFCGGKGHFPRDCSKFVQRSHSKQCNRCQKFGHHPVDCTNPAVAGPNSMCFRCQKLGHLQKNCRNMKVATPRDQCYNCMEYGHLQRDCRNPRKANQFTECTNCGGKGHYARECSNDA